VDTQDHNAFTAAGVTAAPDMSCITLDSEVLLFLRWRPR